MSAVTLRVRDRVAYLTLNSPKTGNALDPGLTHAFRDAAESLEGRDDIGAVVLTGAGKNFCVGGDLRFMHDAGDDVADAVFGLASTMHAGIEALASLDAPVICAVRGAAAGGGMSIAISADLVLASETAHFTVAYTAIGFSTDGGASWTLPRLVGLRRAMELALLNERLSAAQALRTRDRHPRRRRRRARGRGRDARAPARRRPRGRARGGQAADPRFLDLDLQQPARASRPTRSPGSPRRRTAARAFWRFWTSVRHTSESHEFNGPHPDRRSRPHRQ